MEGDSVGPTHPPAPVHHVRRRASDAPPDRRDSGNRRHVPQAEPHRAGAHHLRAPGLADAHWQEPHPAGPGLAGGARAAWHPDPAGPSRPRAGPAEAGRDRGSQRSAARHRRAAGRADAAGAGGGERRGGGRRVERMGAALSPAGLPPADRQPRAVLAARPQGAPAGLSAVRLRGAAGGLPGPLDRLGGGGLSEVSATGRAECPLPAVALGPREEPGVARAGAGGPAVAGGLGAAARVPAGPVRVTSGAISARWGPASRT